MPFVDFRLQLIAAAQQRGVARRHLLDEARESVPEIIRLNTGSRYHLRVDEIVKTFIDGDFVNGDTWSHGSLLGLGLATRYSICAAIWWILWLLILW